jgi:hypothetical protein
VKLKVKCVSRWLCLLVYYDAGQKTLKTHKVINEICSVIFIFCIWLTGAEAKFAAQILFGRVTPNFF